MRVFLSPQFREDDRINYEFKDDIVVAKMDNKEETFDFSSMPDGKAERIDSDVFELCPIISAERKSGILFLEIINFISFEASEEERFPEWKEAPIIG